MPLWLGLPPESISFKILLSSVSKPKDPSICDIPAPRNISRSTPSGSGNGRPTVSLAPIAANFRAVNPTLSAGAQSRIQLAGSEMSKLTAVDRSYEQRTWRVAVCFLVMKDMSPSLLSVVPLAGPMIMYRGTGLSPVKKFSRLLRACFIAPFTSWTSRAMLSVLVCRDSSNSFMEFSCCARSSALKTFLAFSFSARAFCISTILRWLESFSFFRACSRTFRSCSLFCCSIWNCFCCFSMSLVASSILVLASSF
mmetsp:Transcript_14894/g.27661  ORF Transcript_14894/g.27661 Transcript_14894/m.27661 type:complete len:253 (-) Transcript_14894:2712-3470(-)